LGWLENHLIVREGGKSRPGNAAGLSQQKEDRQMR
jgi:hypothetical protein